MYSRPKPEETEEHLLRLQRQFQQDQLENKVKLAATVVNAPKEPEPGTSDSQIPDEDIQDQLANTFEAIPADHSIGKIVQRTNPGIMQPLSFIKEVKGFPQPKKRDLSLRSNAGVSIFAQQFKKMKPEPIKPVPKIALPPKSAVLMGEEMHEIHQENVRKLETMSQEEILEEKERLMSTMDPALIAFLKSRRANLEQQEKVTQSIKTVQKEENLSVDDIETPAEILKQPQADSWLNFDRIETGKLAWMQHVHVPKINKEKSFEARFDLQGWLLPYAEEITEQNRILFHHGEEPERPGYTLQELIQLSRSNVMQQKIVALDTIANILAVQSTGVYEGIIDLPLEQIFFVLRFSLDDNTPSVLNSAIKAMRNLIYNQIDEACLDALSGFGFGRIQPVLAVDNETKDDNTVNDQQLAESNLIRCLIRTEILTRIRYVIDTVCPPLETVVYCIEILIRLCRDSQFVMTKVYNFPDLLGVIIKNFLPNQLSMETVNCYGTPLHQVVKFLRVLASRSQTIAKNLCEKYKVMDCLLLYMSSLQFSVNSQGLKLQTESLYLFTTFLRYNLSLEYFHITTPILLDLVNNHYCNTDLKMTYTFIRHSHLAALLILIGTAYQNKCHMVPFSQLVTNCTSKWIQQFTQLTEFQCGKLQSISALFQLMSQRDDVNNFAPLILQLISSSGFAVVTKNIGYGSMLLNNYETIKSGANIKSLESACWNASEHTIPLIQTNSAVPFLSALSKLVLNVETFQVKLAFINNENVLNYLESLRKSANFYLGSNWFTRVESEFIVNILKISIQVKNDIDTQPFYEIAVKALSIFNSEQKRSIEFILCNIIFCQNFYPSQVLMSHLNIAQRSESLQVSLNYLDEISTVYSQVLGLNQNVPDFTTSLSFDVSLGNVVPVDWIYTPIIVLYSNQQENKSKMSEKDQVFIIKNCLRWILIYETYFPELAALINPTDRFCRLACAFLGSDNLFLEPEIHNLLEACLRNIVTHQDQIDFNKEIQGLTSFQDLYTQLLEQYQGVSYGDVLFGNFILVPLAQKHSVKLRKTLWSEYMGVVQTFNVTRQQCVSNVDLFLQPVEQDLSLLKCYHRAIVSNSVRKHSILYEIAEYHVQQHVLRLKNRKMEHCLGVLFEFSARFEYGA